MKPGSSSKVKSPFVPEAELLGRPWKRVGWSITFDLCSVDAKCDPGFGWVDAMFNCEPQTAGSVHWWGVQRPISIL